MARESRSDVDYFPHDCVHGRKMYIIETKYGNDGYATWFKILEQLGKANNHYLDISDESDLMFLTSICRVNEDKLKSILNDLAKLGAIDQEMYDEHQVIFSQKFTNSVTDAYRKRKNKIFQYGDLLKKYPLKTTESGGRNTQTSAGLPEVIPKEEKRKGKERKEEERRGKESADSTNPIPPKIDYSKLKNFFNEHRGQMPEVKIFSKTRKTRISNIIKNHSKEELIQVILLCEKSNFIQGQNDRNWIGDFDWITKQANFIKILEGNYNNKPHGKSTSNNTGSNSGKISGRATISADDNYFEFA